MATGWIYAIQEQRAIPEGLHVSFFVAFFGDDIPGNLVQVGLSTVVPFSSTVDDIQNAMATAVSDYAASENYAITPQDVQVPSASQSPAVQAQLAGGSQVTGG